MCKKNLDECRTAKDFIGYADYKGGRIVPSTHGVKIYGPEAGNGTYGYALIHSNHPKELPTGTRCALKKALIAIGLGLVALAWVLAV